MRGDVPYALLVSLVGDGSGLTQQESDMVFRARGKGAEAECRGDERKQLTGTVSVSTLRQGDQSIINRRSRSLSSRNVFRVQQYA